MNAAMTFAGLINALFRPARGDYIAHGIRHRASELVTREGHQSELELHAKLQNEVGAERLTRLDKMPLSEQHEQGVIDLRPGEGAIWLVPASSSREVLRKDCPAMKSLGWASCLCAPLA